MPIMSAERAWRNLKGRRDDAPRDDASNFSEIFRQNSPHSSHLTTLRRRRLSESQGVERRHMAHSPAWLLQCDRSRHAGAGTPTKEVAPCSGLLS